MGYSYPHFCLYALWGPIDGAMTRYLCCWAPPAMQMVSSQGNLGGPPTLCRAVLCTYAVAGSWECLHRLEESQVVKNSTEEVRLNTIC